MARPAGYRPEIDGMRAVAVLPVALFHANVAGFAGGFVGVDIFFVISGWLITGILVPPAGEVRPTLALFYERRARRIVPALGPVLAAALVGGWLLFIPEDYRRLTQLAAAASLFFANVLLAMRNDYFSSDEGFTPLIHTWSLSVEEQFYLLYPMAVLAILRWRPVLLRPLLALTLVASLALAFVMAPIFPQWAFNALPTRAWELLAGACAVLDPRPVRTNGLLAWTGLLLIATGFAVIGSQAAIRGPLLLLPVLGTLLVLRHAARGTSVAHLLSLGPLVRMGTISYGFYLWHQVLLSLVHYRYFGSEPSGMPWGALALALGLSWLSALFYEQPVRDGRLWASRKRLAAGCAVIVFAGAGAGFAGHARWIEPWSAANVLRMDGSYAGPASQRILPAKPRPVAFLLFGDSFARQYYPAFTARFGRGALISESACLAIPGATNQPAGSTAQIACSAQYREAWDFARTRSVPAFIWAQQWDRDLYRTSDGASLGTTTDHAGRNLFAALESIRAALPPRTRLVLMGNPPQAWSAGPAMWNGWIRCKAYHDATCPLAFPAALGQGREANAVLRRFAESHANVTFVDPYEGLCRANRCFVVDEGRLLYNDGAHLTALGARRVARLVPPLAIAGPAP